MGEHIDVIYKRLAEDVLVNGEYIGNGRTKEGYYSVFGRQIRVDLQEGFPALTTKKLFFRGVAVENCWFLRGDTNVKYLQDHNIRIWDEWATAEQTAKFGRPEGELGPVYGKQWRFYGDSEPPFTDFKTINEEYANLCSSRWNWRKALDEQRKKGFVVQGVDQIQNVIDQIKTSPMSRRLIVNGWNPMECDKVALPPCHTMFQFKVSHGGTRLNCQLYQRSADIFLGVPFNIASYALLTHMIAQVTGLEVGEFVHTFGDLHLYENHVEQIKEQLSREPKPLAKLWLNPEVKDINNFTPDDIKLIDYQSHPAIKGAVAI